MYKRVMECLFIMTTLLFIFPGASHAMHHCGIIPCDQTWRKADNPHIVTCDITIDEGCTLTLEPGVRVYFYYAKKFVVNGTLKAQGVASDKVYFTSAKDTTGGTGGVAGDWRGILINGKSAGDSLSYCTIRFAGRVFPSTYPAIEIGGASPVFLSCAVYSNYSVAFKSCGGKPKIVDCSIYNNGGDAYWVCELKNLPEIVFSGGVSQMNSIVYGNQGNGIRFDGGTVSGDSVVVVPDMGPCYWLKASDMTVDDGTTVTLAPGVIWKTNSGFGINVNGTLRASSAVITSYEDDVRQDTNGDGASGGVAGDWRGILISGSGASDTLSYCTIRFAGRVFPSTYPAIEIGGSSPVFLNCAVYSNYSVAFKNCGGKAKIYDCSVYNNGGDAYWVCDLKNLPEIVFSGGVSQMNSIVYGNHGNGIRFDGGAVSEDAVVPDMGPCYWLKASDLTIAGGTKLTFDPGVIWKMNTGRSIIVNGTFKTFGVNPEGVNPDRRVVITSYRDDMRQDTNGDGVSHPAKGDWSNIPVSATSTADSLWYSTICYGSATKALLEISGTSPSIKGCIFQNAKIYVQTSQGANPKFRGCGFIGDTTITAIDNKDNTVVVDADTNYWGAATGPYDRSVGSPCYNPAGRGCRVSDYVDYCSMWQPVATLLQNSQASFKDHCVTIEWTLSELSPGAEFTILRAKEPSNSFGELPSNEIRQDGMSFSFADRSYEPGERYRYRVMIHEDGGSNTLFETNAIAIPAMPLTLSQNYPNPFNPSTTIQYYLPEPSDVSLKVYDMAGRQIACLVDKNEAKGLHSVKWDGLNNRGMPVSSGVYFCRFEAGNKNLMKKMILLR